MAAADFGHSAQADLAMGTTDADNGRGAVNVICGSPDGLQAGGNQLTIRGTCVWAQEALGLRPIKKIEPMALPESVEQLGRELPHQV